MFSYIEAFIQDPRATLISILLAFPGRLLAISAHEFAHAWAADKCGDPTARMLGRLTLNPMKHLDLIGTLMMLVLGFGWARPVPVNPNNFRNYRRDDLKVSIAGVTMNLILFLAGFLGCTALVIASLSRIGQGYGELVAYAASVNPELITVALGKIPGYIYQMLVYFVQVNLCLALFNLLPVPPLDGYHVVNDLLLKRRLFASEKAARTAMGILFVLMVTGLLGTGLSYAMSGVLRGVGWVVYQLVRLTGLV